MMGARITLRRGTAQPLARAITSCIALVVLGAGTASADQKQPAAGMTSASLQTLPDWSGWWNYNVPFANELARNPPPMRSDGVAKIRDTRAQDRDTDPKRWCRPPQFAGYSGGFVDSVEFLFTPGRVTLLNESGLVRRIYTDGRALPTDVEASNPGTSVGHWEGETLVVETIGINPKALFPASQPGAVPIGQNVRITERITLRNPSTLEFDVTIVAPDVLTTPDHRKRLYLHAPKERMARDVSFCVDFDRSIDPVTGKQRFDMTPPRDLPPPPPK